MTLPSNHFARLYYILTDRLVLISICLTEKEWSAWLQYASAQIFNFCAQTHIALGLGS